MAIKATVHSGNNLTTGQRLELLDRAFKDMGDALAAKLAWMDNIFGRAERLVKYDAGKRRIYTPCWYYHDNEYTELTPTDTLGNFAFFWVDDPQEMRSDHYLSVDLEARFSVIFWYDYRKIYNAVNRNREQVKADILAALNTMTLRNGGTFRLTRIYELAENIYRGFSLDETDNQFLMQPYGGIRIDGELYIEANCIQQSNNVTTTTAQP